MGLSIAISGGITMMVILLVLATLFIMLNQVFVASISSSQINDLEDSISKTSMDISSLNACSGSVMGKFGLANMGIKKLSNFDKFYKRDELFYLLDVLDKNQKKSYVKLFLSKLSNGAQTIEELIKIHNKWLKQTKYDITQMKINKLRQKRLFSLQSQFINEATRKQIKVKK